MKIAFIGDIVGKPGRSIVKQFLPDLIKEYNLELVIANGENVSHGFGITTKNAKELFDVGIDIFTSGNHIWDKQKEILPMLHSCEVLRPDNYPDEVVGTGCKVVNDVAIISLMGMFAMPQVLNPFTHILQKVDILHQKGIKNIFIDFHAEATSEKRILFELLKGKVSAICGTHTHIGTDDLEITQGTFYVSDVGLSGCRDKIIGMETNTPIQKALTGVGKHFDIPKQCKKILQIIILDIVDGKTIDAFKLKFYDDLDIITLKPIFN